MAFVYFLSALHGFVVQGYGLSQTNILYKVLPEDQRPAYYGIWVTMTTAGAFIFPMIGVALSEWLGIRWAIFTCASLTLVASTLFWIFPMRFETTATTPAIVEAV